MSRPCCYFAAVSLVSFTGTLFAQGETEKDLKIKILAEWNSVFERINSGHLEQRIEYSSRDDPKHLRLDRVDVIRRTFKRGGGSLRSSEVDDIDAQTKATRRRHDLQITNRQYTAQLRKPKNGDGWLLTETNQDVKNVTDQYRQELVCPWMDVGNMQLNQCLQEAGFVFTRTEELRDQATPGLLRCYFVYDFYYDRSGRDKSHPVRNSGYIDFDPIHSYRPTNYQYDVKSESEDGAIRGVLEYENAAGFPVLKSITREVRIRAVLKNVLIIGNEIHTFSNVNYNSGSVRDEEFRLSHYGLPEPVGVNWERPARWYLWIGLSAFLAVGLAFLLRMVRRRYQSSDPAKKTMEA